MPTNLQEPLAARKLTRDEIAFYKDNGYLIVHNVLPEEMLSDLNAELHQLYLERVADPDLTQEERNNIHGLGETSERSQKLASDERILTLVEDLVSPGISLFSAKLISKGPNEAQNVCHWHQDDAYWLHISQAKNRLSIWVPLQDTDQSNGCLRVVPASHGHGIIEHEPRSSRSYGACRLSFFPGEAEVEGAVDCPVSAGSVVIFSAQTYHSSLGNFSDAHRRAFIITYQEATATNGKKGEFKILRPA